MFSLRSSSILCIVLLVQLVSNVYQAKGSESGAKEIQVGDDVTHVPLADVLKKNGYVRLPYLAKAATDGVCFLYLFSLGEKPMKAPVTFGKMFQIIGSDLWKGPARDAKLVMPNLAKVNNYYAGEMLADESKHRFYKGNPSQKQCGRSYAILEVSSQPSETDPKSSEFQLKAEVKKYTPKEKKVVDKCLLHGFPHIIVPYWLTSTAPTSRSKPAVVPENDAEGSVHAMQIFFSNIKNKLISKIAPKSNWFTGLFRKLTKSQKHRCFNTGDQNEIDVLKNFLVDGLTATFYGLFDDLGCAEALTAVGREIVNNVLGTPVEKGFEPDLTGEDVNRIKTAEEKCKNKRVTGRAIAASEFTKTQKENLNVVSTISGFKSTESSTFDTPPNAVTETSTTPEMPESEVKEDAFEDVDLGSQPMAPASEQQQ